MTLLSLMANTVVRKEFGTDGTETRVAAAAGSMVMSPNIPAVALVNTRMDKPFIQSESEKNATAAFNQYRRRLPASGGERRTIQPWSSKGYPAPPAAW